ncbi:glycosyltransferase family 1 protein [Rhodobacteraceae bacterium W635]|uniref:glycosyltransferase family 4 protein n=1 Tax=Nioella halotolerans TaxID=2303578 RepID=UPI000E3C1C4A|nr:glycosyltransferase family 1 protein [Rhodobacteraceae bacterium W635]
MSHPPLCLDLTRLLSRVGRGPLTGVDRVERAYADWVLARDDDPRFLARTSRGYILFGADGARAFLAALDGKTSWPRPDLLSRLTGKGELDRHGAEALLRRHAIGRCLHSNLFRLLSQHLREGTVYLNTGHSNLSRQCLMAVAANPDVRVAVFLHDVIPLDYPQFARPEIVDHFRAMVIATAEFADIVLCNSQETRARLMQDFGTERPIVAAHLGLPDLPAEEPLFPDTDPDTPRFVAIGTIEPRKNHALLLDVWEELPAKCRPHLHIVGARGWADPSLFRRLETHALRGTAIFEHNALSDGQVRSLLTGAHGLLFPTLAEGFGYPPLEAARLGVLPICSDLPVLRETLGDCAVYLDPADRYSWIETIKKRMRASLAERPGPSPVLPTWQAHFETVAQALGAGRAGD